MIEDKGAIETTGILKQLMLLFKRVDSLEEEIRKYIINKPPPEKSEKIGRIVTKYVGVDLDHGMGQGGITCHVRHGVQCKFFDWILDEKTNPIWILDEKMNPIFPACQLFTDGQRHPLPLKECETYIERLPQCRKFQWDFPIEGSK